MLRMLKKGLCLLLCMVMMCGLLAGCAGGMGTTAGNKIVFYVYGSLEQVDMYTKLVDKFNATYGKEHDMYVSLSAYDTTGYTSKIQSTVNSKNSGPDVFLVEDTGYKSYIRSYYVANIQEYLDNVTDIELGDIMDTVTQRLRYDIDTNTSEDTDPLYGLPLDTQPTAIYYNVTVFQSAGINVISVDEEDLDAWNNNEIPDNNGKYKSDFPKLNGVTVPAKGYYRSESPYYEDGDDTERWYVPSEDEILVFNNRIAMNWDEVEDLAMLFSAETNPDPSREGVSKYGTSYGYFAEWWFYYGWSVGGDCLTDLSTEGDWNFSLLDPNPNYIVNSGKTFTGKVTGKVYEGGDTIAFLDKMDIEVYGDGDFEVLVPDDYGDYHHGAKDGELAGISPEVTSAVENGVLSEMPSTREAFNRYLRLGAGIKANIDGVNGYNIAPNPASINSGTITTASSFWSGKVAMVCNTSLYMADTSEQFKKRGNEWDIAPLPVYKTYTNPDDPNCDEVAIQGKAAGHSNTYTMCVRYNSQKKQMAATFIKWMASEAAQKIRAENGYFPNQESLIDDVKFPNGVAADNVVAFSEALTYETCGDWMYMPDHAWIDKWAVPLNSYVRNGTMTYDEWYKPGAGNKEVIKVTNEYLKLYSQWRRSDI